MVKSYPSTFIFLMILIAIISCKDDDFPPIGDDIVWDCHHNAEWDSISISTFLIGEWEWEYISCYENRSFANDSQNSGLVIDIKSNETLEVIDNGQIIQSSNWEIFLENDGLFRMEADPIISEILGRIFICKDRIKFDDSYRDGCDNFFKKK